MNEEALIDHSLVGQELLCVPALCRTSDKKTADRLEHAMILEHFVPDQGCYNMRCLAG